MDDKFKQLPSADLIPLEIVVGLECMQGALEVDNVYAQDEHKENVFGRIYTKNARCIGHIDLVTIVADAALYLQKNFSWTLIVKDCLRPLEAQQKMIETKIVQQNPQWLEEPRFLSSPGMGGHPRGMAIDISAKDKAEKDIDFGTSFDHFSDSAEAQHNPAHRQYPQLTPTVKRNRERLDKAMLEAARKRGKELVFLSTEWWDYRLPAEISNQYAPISDNDLKSWQKIMTEPEPIPQNVTKEIASRLTDDLNKFGNF